MFYTAWNVISIIVFFRYITQPSALVEDGGASEAFIKHYKITKREGEIIDLISHGLTNKEIASELNVSLTTVRTHIYNVFKKAEVQSRVELLRMMSGYRE
ncbi:MAG: helix-turn-helix transcriptional regulator [Spirochaetales bacterium]|nr:helix-turn-helix transcriptional regulator [Spirochaetales bacterium]